MTAEELIHHTFSWEVAPGVAGDGLPASLPPREGAGTRVTAGS